MRVDREAFNDIVRDYLADCGRSVWQDVAANRLNPGEGLKIFFNFNKHFLESCTQGTA